MDSIYFRDPLGQLMELACYRFVPPDGRSHAEVLLEAHRLRVARGDYNIAEVHLADAIEALIRRDRDSLSDDRSPRDPYASGRKGPGGSGGKERKPAKSEAVPAKAKPTKQRVL